MAASSIIGWYGPLIDLSNAACHIDDFVQLLVFVHSSQPQYNQTLKRDYASNGGTLLKTNIQVGDDTRSYFTVSIWHKHMGSTIVTGDIILLQNVKIIKFRDVLEATTIHISSLLVVVHSYELFSSQDICELVKHGQLGETARSKLRRIIDWIHQTESTFRHIQKLDSSQKKSETIKNWKVNEEKKSRDCLSVCEALRLPNSCANFHASIGEIFMPFISRPDEFDDEKHFVSRRLFTMVENNIVEDLISKGCKLCDSLIISRSVPEQIDLPLYCKKGPNYHHHICLIYSPFLLYVWDQGGQIPLLVKNKAAEILFGNITAENVYKCYQEHNNRRSEQGPERRRQSILNSSTSRHPGAWRSDGLTSQNKNQGSVPVECNGKIQPNFYGIWLILLKTLLQQGKNSPFRFKIIVDREKDFESGRFELVSMTMPCYEGGKF